MLSEHDEIAQPHESMIHARARHDTGLSSLARRLLFVALAGVLSAVPRASLSAQTVTGSVLDATSSAPLQGVLVSLLNADGERVRAVLSDETGRFVIPTEAFGDYSLRAERIGLRTTTSATFRLFSTIAHDERILMGDRAVEIAGLVVDSRVQQCRLDRDRAVQLQRWWREVRTALDVSSVVQGTGLVTFEIERFERQWDARLESVIATESHNETLTSSRPFVSAEADFLADGGFVQGDLMGQRQYYAPDADVLLSSVFLAQHCFSLSESDDESVLGLTFEPTEDNRRAEIMGTLWVDTTSAELQSLDFRYVNVSGLPENESGGGVSFEYLPSGAWIVSDWYIRMPRLALRAWMPEEDQLQLLGYVDIGGDVNARATVAEASEDPLGRSGAIRGVVHDSIRGRALAGATVSVLGTSHRVLAGPDGSFVIPEVPVGEQRVTFAHLDAAEWQLGAPVARVTVSEGDTVNVELALPGFRQAARVLCLGSAREAQSVLVGVLTDAAGQPVSRGSIHFEWKETRPDEKTYDMTQEVLTGSDGRFVICTIPAEVVVRAAITEGNRRREVFELTLPTHDIVFRRVVTVDPRD